MKNENYIIIDKGENKLIEWSDTLTESISKIQYHQIIYIKDKKIAVIGESENEVWIDIDKKDLNNKTLIDFEKFLKSQKEDRFEKFIDYLKQNNIKFEKGDWQSFDNVKMREEQMPNATIEEIEAHEKLKSIKSIQQATAMADCMELRKLKLKFIEQRKKLTPKELLNYKVSDMEKRVDKEMKELWDKATSGKK